MKFFYIFILVAFLLGCRERLHASSVTESKTQNTPVETEILEKALKVFFKDPVTANIMTAEYSAYSEWQNAVNKLETALAKAEDDEAKLEIFDEIESLNEKYRVEHSSGESRIKSALEIVNKVNKLQFRDYFLTDDDLDKIRGEDELRYSALKKSRDDIVVALNKIQSEHPEAVKKWEDGQQTLIKIFEDSKSDNVKLAIDDQIESNNTVFKIKWTGFLFLRNTTK